MVDDRIGNDSDPGGMPKESSADETDVAHAEIYHTLDTKLLVTSFGHASTSYTCSSVGGMLVSADGGVDTIPIPKCEERPCRAQGQGLRREMEAGNGG